MNSQFKYILLINLIYLYSCTGNSQYISSESPVIIERLSDSNENILITPVADISSFNDNLILVEKTSNRILVLKDDFENFKIIGQSGRGPGDLLYPTSVEVHNDNIYIYERDNHRISKFNLEGDFISSHNITGTSELYSFEVVNDSIIIYTSDMDEGYIVKQNINTGNTTNHGTSNNSEVGFLDRKKNLGYLFELNNKFIYLSPYKLEIKLYDDAFNLITTYNLKNDEYFQNAIDSSEQLPPNAIKSFLSHATLHKNFLYISAYFDAPEDGRSLDHFLRYKIVDSTIVNDAVYKVSEGNGYYSKIHVTDNYIYAYDNRTSDIHKFQ